MENGRDQFLLNFCLRLTIYETCVACHINVCIYLCRYVCTFLCRGKNIRLVTAKYWSFLCWQSMPAVYFVCVLVKFLIFAPTAIKLSLQLNLNIKTVLKPILIYTKALYLMYARKLFRPIFLLSNSPRNG